MEHTPEASLQNMRIASQSIAEMLARMASEMRRLQKQEEATLGHCFENREELCKSYDAKSMKELTAILKDIAAVEKALNENSDQQDAAAQTGVVLLPPVLDELT